MTTTTGTARFRDGPDATFDSPADVLFTVPAGERIELRAGPGGTTLVCRKRTTDALTLDEMKRANAAWLEKRGTKQRVEPDRLVEVVKQEAGQAILRYEFPARGKRTRLGPPGDWTLRVLAPGGVRAECKVSADIGQITKVEVAV